MRRTGNLWTQLLDRENFREAWHRAISGKRDRSSIRRFAARLEGNLAKLRGDVEAGAAPYGRYFSFVIHDPKQRIISAPCLEDRIVHHAVMRVCEPVFERIAIFDSYACRRGKGQVKALERARHFAAGAGWFLQMDVRKYFDHVNHAVLLKRLERCFREKKMLALFGHLLSGFGSAFGRGLPIGSLTSQHFANFYLGHLDRFVKERLHARRYVRYMDDFVLWHETKEELLCARDQIQHFLREHLCLEVKEPVCARTKGGMDFLGYRIYPRSMIVNRKGRLRFQRTVRMLDSLIWEGRLTEAEAQARAQSLVAFTLAGNTRCLRWRQQLFMGQGCMPKRAGTGSTGAAALPTTLETAPQASATGTTQPTATGT